MKEVLRVYWFLLFLFLVTSLAQGQVRRDSASRIRFGTALPATCNPSIGSVFFLITPGSPLGMHQCLATDSYTPMVGSMSGAGSDNQIAVFTGPSDIEGTAAFTFDSSTGLLGLVNDTASVQLGAALDAQIHRGDAADILEQRRGLNPQEWRLYERFVSFSDYDRLAFYIGGGPPLLTAEIEAQSTVAGQGISIEIEALPGSQSDGRVTLLNGVSSFSLAPSSASLTTTGQGLNISSAGTSSLSTNGFIFSIGVGTGTSGNAVVMDLAGQGAASFGDSHKLMQIGRGELGNIATWRSYVDVLDISANSNWILEQDRNSGGFTNRVTVTDTSAMTMDGSAASFNTLMPSGSTPIIGLLLDSADLTGAGQRDSDSVVLTGNAHDGATARSARWQMFTDITNNSGASTFRLQLSAAGGAFGDEFQVFSTGEVNIPDGSGQLSFGTAGDLGLFRDDAEPGELGQRGGLVDQVFNIYNTYTSSSNNELGEIGWIPVNNTFVVGTKKGASAGTARPMVLRTDEITAVTISITQDVTLASNLAVSGVGPHSIAGVTFGAVQLLIGSTFTSDGAGDIASGLFHTPAIVGAAGDTSALTGVTFTAGITTQTATESIANIAQLQVNEPNITDNLTGSITQASTVLITGAPTEGVSNDALRIAAGRSFFGDQLIVDDDSTEAFQVRKAGDAGDVFNVNTVSDIVTVEGGLKVEGTVASSFGSPPPMTITSAFTIDTTFTAGVSGTSAHALDIFPDFTGAAGHTTALSLLTINGNISTQTATESIANVSTMALNEPSITDNLTGTITNAQTLLIFDAPTEGSNNFAIRVVSGLTQYGGTVQGAIGSSYALLNEAATAINPTLIPNRLITGTGVSGVSNEGAGALHLVVDDTSVFNASLTNINANITNTFEVNGAFFVDGLADTIQMRVDAHSTQTALIWRVRDSSAATIMTIADNNRVEAGNTGGWGLLNEASTNTNPTIMPNRNDTNTGIGGNSTAVDLIVSSVSRVGVTTTGVGFNAQTPIARPNYTATAVAVEDRTLLASASATTINNNNVLAALIADLIEYGLLQ